MKTPLWASAFVLAFAVGCGENSSTSSSEATDADSSSSGNPLTAPVDYLGAVGNAKQSAEKTIDTVAINQAIQLFQVENGRFPKDLNELVQSKHLAKIPEAPYGMKIVYDPAIGQAKVVKQ